MSNLQGTTVPSNAFVEKVYINIDLSIEEVVSIIDSANLTYNFSSKYTVVDGIEISNMLGKTIIVNNEVIFREADSMNTGVFVGWKEDFNGIVAVNKQNSYGTQNDVLSSLFSITPLTQAQDGQVIVSKSKLTAIGDNIRKQTNTTKQYTLDEMAKMKLGGAGAIITTKGGWVGTAVPNEGMVENVYFNTNLSVEEVISTIKNANLTQETVLEGQPEGAISYELFRYYPDDYGSNTTFYSNLSIMYMPQSAANENGVPIDCDFLMIQASPSLDNNDLFVFISFDPSLVGITEDIAVRGWNFESLAFNVCGNDENIGTQNDKLSSLFSITPFVQATGEEVLLEGEYDGSTVSIDDLSGGWEGTDVPTEGYVEKVYFNTNLSIKEVLEIFNSLTFVDYQSNVKMWSCFTDSTMQSDNIIVLKMIEETNTIYAISVHKNGYDYAHSIGGDMFLFSVNETTGVTNTYGDNDGDGWLDVFDGTIEFNCENALSSIAPQMNFTPENEKVSQLFSTTPFVQSEPNTIDLKPYIDKKQIPLKFNLTNLSTGTDTSDATATSEDILLGKTAYVNDVKVVGAIEEYDGEQEGGIDNTQEDELITKTSTSYVNNRVDTIASYTFYGCVSLMSVEFQNITKVGSYAFQNCKALTNVSMPNVKNIANYAFYQCDALQNIELPKIYSIGAQAFDACLGLISINISNVSRLDNSSFQSCSKLLNINIPKVSSLPNRCFFQCRSLISANISNMTYISNYAFQLCNSLKAIIIQQTEKVCTLLGTSAFTQCYHFDGTVDATYNPDGLKDGYIYVPDSLLDQYKQATNWSTYADAIKPLSELPQEYKDLYNIS